MLERDSGTGDATRDNRTQWSMPISHFYLCAKVSDNYSLASLPQLTGRGNLL